MFFGKSWDKKTNLENLWPTRFIFRDLKIAKKEDIKKVKIESFDEKDLYTIKNYTNWQSEWESLTEEKTEVAIDRRTWTAGSGQFSPRPVERVFAWTVFKWELVVRFFEKEEILKQWNENKKLLKNIDEDIESIEDKIQEVFILENKDWNIKNKIESEEDIMKYCFLYWKWEIKEDDFEDSQKNNDDINNNDNINNNWEWNNNENKKVDFYFLKQLLEDDYLGWMWTRGSGQVEIIFEEIN